MEAAIAWLVGWVHSMGYWGLFIMTMVESTFVPLPAEITVIPAGYLVQQGHMDGLKVLAFCTAGTLSGALVNYAISYHLGRRMIVRYGRYFLMNEEKLEKMEGFFRAHGGKSTFIGRILPGVKHYISFPAGLGRMKLGWFCLYTTLGGAFWLGVLLMIGYYLGQNEGLVKQYVLTIKFILLGSMAIAGLWYGRRLLRRGAKKPS